MKTNRNLLAREIVVTVVDELKTWLPSRDLSIPPMDKARIYERCAQAVAAILEKEAANGL